MLTSQPARAFSRGWESPRSLLSSPGQLGPGHPPAAARPGTDAQSASVTFLLALVVMAKPLGSSRAVLCFFISCTETTGITTWKAKRQGDGQGWARRELREFLSQGRGLTRIAITPQAERRRGDLAFPRDSLVFIKGHGIPPTLISARRWFLLDQNGEDTGKASSSESP